MSKRKGMSKMLRFEVFKRDRFTCQYCGSKAPDVVLHVDHIRPVADGGKNDILNLATACQDCNSGKGARKLDDSAAIDKQRAQIEDLEDRREQLEMMLAWRDQAEREKTDVVAEVAKRMAERGGYEPNDNGKNDIRRWLKRYSLAEVLAALDDAFDAYMEWDGDKPNQDAWERAFRKVPAIANLNQQAVDKPYMPKLAYIQGILRRRFNDKFGRYITALEDIHLSGTPLSSMEHLAKRSDDWDGFCDVCNRVAEHLKSEGRHGED